MSAQNVKSFCSTIHKKYGKYYQHLIWYWVINSWDTSPHRLLLFKSDMMDMGLWTHGKGITDDELINMSHRFFAIVANKRSSAGSK